MLDSTTTGTTAAARVYGLASYLLVNNGATAIANDGATGPDTFWAGYNADLGAPLAARYSWSNVWRRDYAGGIVLVNEPSRTTRTLTIPGGLPGPRRRGAHVGHARRRQRHRARAGRRPPPRRPTPRPPAGRPGRARPASRRRPPEARAPRRPRAGASPSHVTTSRLARLAEGPSPAGPLTSSATGAAAVSGEAGQALGAGAAPVRAPRTRRHVPRRVGLARVHAAQLGLGSRGDAAVQVGRAAARGPALGGLEHGLGTFWLLATAQTGRRGRDRSCRAARRRAVVPYAHLPARRSRATTRDAGSSSCEHRRRAVPVRAGARRRADGVDWARGRPPARPVRARAQQRSIRSSEPHARSRRRPDRRVPTSAEFSARVDLARCARSRGDAAFDRGAAGGFREALPSSGLDGDDRQHVAQRAHDVRRAGVDQLPRVAAAVDADPDRDAVLDAEAHVRRAVADRDRVRHPRRVGRVLRRAARSALSPCGRSSSEPRTTLNASQPSWRGPAGRARGCEPVESISVECSASARRVWSASA